MGDATTYRIGVRGELGSEWSAWFYAIKVESVGDGTSVLTARLPDQAALHGLLARVRDLGLEIVSVVASDERETAR